MNFIRPQQQTQAEADWFIRLQQLPVHVTILTMSNLPTLEYVSWDEFHQMGFELAQQITELRKDLDQIVSISRGGHVLSRILSDFLELPVFSISIQSYQALKQHEIKITQEIAPELIQKHVLLVDEVIDSGRTLKRAYEYLEELGAEAITSVAIHVKPKAIATADFYIAETNKWVVYPYEVRETVSSLLPIWKKAGLNETDMLYELARLGMNEIYLRYFVTAIRNS